jgi:hypothetical protein
MASENVELLALAAGLLCLNAFGGPRLASVIARLFARGSSPQGEPLSQDAPEGPTAELTSQPSSQPSSRHAQEPVESRRAA